MYKHVSLEIDLVTVLKTIVVPISTKLAEINQYLLYQDLTIKL